MGRRARQEKGGKDPFGTCLPLTAHPSCCPSLRGLGALCQTTALQKGKSGARIAYLHCGGLASADGK